MTFEYKSCIPRIAVVSLGVVGNEALQPVAVGRITTRKTNRRMIDGIIHYVIRRRLLCDQGWLPLVRIALVTCLATGCSENSGQRWWKIPSSPSAAPAISLPVSNVHLVLEPRALYGGQMSVGTLSIYPPAQGAGTLVGLSSSDPAIALPSSVLVPGGSSKVTFSISTRPVPTDVSATISASMLGTTGQASLNVWAVLPTAVTWNAEAGSFIGGGRSDRLTPEDATFVARCEDNELNLMVRGTGGRSVSLFLAAPRGTPLRTGTYEDARRSSFRPPGSPGIDLGIDGTACDPRTGRFVVSEADLGGAGEVYRFAATFEVRCGFNQSFVSGDVRLSGPFPMPPFRVTCLR